jgi:putative tricarboxylic transport membrane protein
MQAEPRLKINDFLAGLLLALLAAGVLWQVRRYPNIPGQDIGPAAFPSLLAWLLLLCGCLLMARGWSARRDTPWVAMLQWLKSPAHALNFGLTLAVLLGYILWSETLGFIVSGVLLLGVLFLGLRLRPVHALPLAGAITLVIHSIFYYGLRVPLPWGVLETLVR